MPFYHWKATSKYEIVQWEESIGSNDIVWMEKYTFNGNNKLRNNFENGFNG